MVENNRSYFNCRRQLFRFFKGSLLTAVAGFNSSSSKAAGTGQSGILTGVTGFEELFSPFSSFLWLKEKTSLYFWLFFLFHQCHFYHTERVSHLQHHGARIRRTSLLSLMGHKQKLLTQCHLLAKVLSEQHLEGPTRELTLLKN